ncbi:unnamed protein product [Mycena citricolor]|uniref:TLC domain-containing protein n=1 Tax=Mycena citricolor TaxID=2018698 RepID=A0AAD2HH99_9AGAR|nr:unnamed protein product [Mycena citricolor]CAK5276525.1 unnamed protein product [Mycena citricolor]
MLALSIDLLLLLEETRVQALSFLGLCAAYLLLSPFCRNVRQASWIVTTIAAAVVTAFSLPFVWDYLGGKGSVNALLPRTALAVGVNRFFQGYLSSDLFLGVLCYRSEVSFLTGWLHHTIYLFITQLAIRADWAHLFCFAAFMEFPTVILGVGSLVPQMRSNILFAATFFVTRIVFHSVLICTFAMPQYRPSGSLVPSGILVSVLPLHLLWFSGCIQGFLRRAKARAAAPLAAHTDTKKLLVHMASPPPLVSTRPNALHLRRLRVRVGQWGPRAILENAKAHVDNKNWVEGVRDGSLIDGFRDRMLERMRSRLASRRPIRPRALAMGRRVSAGLIQVLVPGRDVVLDYVGLGRPS